MRNRLVGFTNSIRVVFLLFFCPSALLAQNSDIDILKKINPDHPTAQYWKQTSNSVFIVGGAATIGQLIYGISSNNTAIKNRAYEQAISIGGSYIISYTLKNFFKRTRPEYAYPDYIVVNKASNDASFPSGHTSAAFAAATTASLQYRKWYVTIPAFLWAGSIGYSRMYLGKHYPTDVLAGAVLGAGSAYATQLLMRKIVGRHPTGKRNQLLGK